MTTNSTASPALQSEAETTVHFPDDWFDPIEALRDRVREFIQADLEAELNLRQIDPPFDAVRADMECLKTPQSGCGGNLRRPPSISRRLKGTCGSTSFRSKRSASGRRTEPGSTRDKKSGSPRSRALAVRSPGPYCEISPPRMYNAIPSECVRFSAISIRISLTVTS